MYRGVPTIAFEFIDRLGDMLVPSENPNATPPRPAKLSVAVRQSADRPSRSTVNSRGGLSREASCDDLDPRAARFFRNASLERAIREYVAHYLHDRNHQGIGNAMIAPGPIVERAVGTVERRARLGGMLSYRRRAAA